MKKDTKELIIKLLFVILVSLGTYIYQNYIESPKSEEKEIELRETIKPIMNTEESFHIYFIDVGQGDCIVIENNNEFALIDAGNREDSSKLIEYFQSIGITNFQYVIGTHAHEDHIGGMPDVIMNFPISHFYMPDTITTTKTYEDVLDALEKKQIRYETPQIDSTFTMANTKFSILSIKQDNIDLNNTSIVLKVNYYNTSYLFMADAPSTIEREILEKDLKSDVLKIGHHGSQYSTSAVFLKKVDPDYAIISVGKDNPYDHPKKITLQKLERLSVKTYRTDKDGTIILSSDGNNIEIETTKTNTNG